MSETNARAMLRKLLVELCECKIEATATERMRAALALNALDNEVGEHGEHIEAKMNLRLARIVDPVNAA